MNNMDIWNKVCTPPSWALKKIAAGRMAGKTDINPQWRIRALTEQFGMCGVGWKIDITKKWTEPRAQGEVMCFVNLNLYVKVDDKWSDPIPGSGGSMLVANELKGLRASDEGYKMATTDAISVACKMIGVAADIYQGEEYSKYNQSHGDDKGDAPKDIDPVSKDEAVLYEWISKAKTLDHVETVKRKMTEVPFTAGALKRINACIAKKESEITSGAQ